MRTTTEKNKKYEWGTEEDEAFQTLKQKLCSAPILALPEGTENFVVYCDASHKGYGAVLMQREKRQLVYIKILEITARSDGNPTRNEHQLTTLRPMAKRENIQYVGGMMRACVLIMDCRTARSHQKSYADVRRKPMEFQVGDMVMLKIIERIGPVAYKLELPDKLRGIHNTFHVSNLKKCMADENLVILLEEIQLNDKLYFIEEPVEIMFDSIKQTRVRHKEQSDSLINKLNLKSVENKDLKAQTQDKVFVITSLKNDLRKLKGKEIVENVVHIPSANTIASGMFKLDLKPLLPSELDFACKYATRIQELLVNVQDTCPNAIIPSAKKVTVKPMNNVKKVRFAEPLTSLRNIKKVASSNTSDSNTPVLSSTGVKCSTSNCRSKPPGNKRNDRISQTPSRNKKNKVEAQPSKVNKVNHVVKPVYDVDVKHSLSKAKSEILCATFNKSMFDGVHDKCLLDLV
ncbi:integrase, catalytic region, zinc finger, CCHC-type containing protein [Tanacetum coccineum]